MYSKDLHGADRGKIYDELTPPFTVGREEGNDIQLNDERVSRCHFKVQRDKDRFVLTDLCTNGTKVNGVVPIKDFAAWGPNLRGRSDADGLGISDRRKIGCHRS